MLSVLWLGDDLYRVRVAHPVSGRTTYLLGPPGWLLEQLGAMLDGVEGAPRHAPDAATVHVEPGPLVARRG